MLRSGAVADGMAPAISGCCTASGTLCTTPAQMQHQSVPWSQLQLLRRLCGDAEPQQEWQSRHAESSIPVNHQSHQLPSTLLQVHLNETQLLQCVRASAAQAQPLRESAR